MRARPRIRRTRRSFVQNVRSLASLALAATLLAGARSASAQEPPAPAPTCRQLKTALVLAGGGAKGAAHIGLMKVLDSLGIRPDLIVGTSIGAITGAMYASGWSGNEIDSLVRKYDIGELVQRYDPRLPRSLGPLLDPVVVWQQSEGRIRLQSGAARESDLIAVMNALLLRGNLIARGSFDRLPIPFRAVATDLRTKASVVLDKGDLAQAVRASFAIPLVFEPITLDGRTLVDGGITDNVPVRIARRLGAQRLIVSRLDSTVVDTAAVGTTTFTASRLMDFLFPEPLDTITPPDVVIRPDLTGYQSLDFARERVDSLIALGYNAAVEKFATQPCIPRGRPRPDRTYERRIAGVTVESGDLAQPELVRRALDLNEGRLIDEDSLGEGLVRVSNSGLAVGVWLNPTATQSGTAFHVRAIDHPRRVAGVGVDYDNTIGGRLWFTVLDRRVFGRRAEGSMMVDLSEVRQHLRLGVRRGTRLGSLLINPMVTTGIVREEVKRFDVAGDVLPDVLMEETYLGLGFERTGVQAWTRVTAELTAWRQGQEAILGAPGGRVEYLLARRNEDPVFRADLRANSRFQVGIIEGRGYGRWGERLELQTRLRGGAGLDLPPHYTLTLGGLEGFAGLQVFELRGDREFMLAQLFRFRAFGPFYARVEPMIGTMRAEDDSLDVNLPDKNAIYGMRGGLEWRTPIGPIRVEYGVNNLQRKQLLFRLGTWAQ